MINVMCCKKQASEQIHKTSARTFEQRHQSLVTVNFSGCRRRCYYSSRCSNDMGIMVAATNTTKAALFLRTFSRPLACARAEEGGRSTF